MSNCLGLFVACIHILPCVFWTEIANSKYLRIICCMKLTNGVALNSFRLSKILCRIKFTIYWHSTSDIPGERIANLNIRIETKKFVGFIGITFNLNINSIDVWEMTHLSFLSSTSSYFTRLRGKISFRYTLVMISIRCQLHSLVISLSNVNVELHVNLNLLID